MLSQINLKKTLALIFFICFIVNAITYSHVDWKKIVYNWIQPASLVENKNLTINDILITVKTSGVYENTRLNDILQTWYPFAKTQTYFVSDKFGKKQFNASNFIYTECGRGHDRNKLCCKLGIELSLYFKFNRKFKWYCHVDDDNYLHVPNLVSFLSNYNHTEDWYFGRASKGQIKKLIGNKDPPEYATFSFGTLGAGVCLSNGTMYKIMDMANETNFVSGCEKINYPDDMYLGYLLEWEKKIKFTNSLKFNHHLDKDQFKSLNDIHSSVTFSFGKTYYKYFDKSCNCSKHYDVVPGISTLFKNDNQKIRSLHCLLFPNIDYCKKMFVKALQLLNNHQNQTPEYEINLPNITDY